MKTNRTNHSCTIFNRNCHIQFTVTVYIGICVQRIYKRILSYLMKDAHISVFWMYFCGSWKRVYFIFRLIYWVCVVFGSSVRALGFTLSFLPLLVLLGANLYFIGSVTGQEAVFHVTPPTTAPPPKQRWWGWKHHLNNQNCYLKKESVLLQKSRPSSEMIKA